MARKEFDTLTPQMFYILLVLNQPRHGYDIMTEIAKVTDDKVKVGAGTLYTLLARFQDDDFIKLVDEVDRKKIYLITEKGRKKLKKEVAKLQLMIIQYKGVYGNENKI